MTLLPITVRASQADAENWLSTKKQAVFGAMGNFFKPAFSKIYIPSRGNFNLRHQSRCVGGRRILLSSNISPPAVSFSRHLAPGESSALLFQGSG